MKDDDTIHSEEDLRNVIGRVEMRCVLDMGLGWHVESALGGWMIAPEFIRQDRDSGIFGRGRAFHVSDGFTVRLLVSTAFVAIKLTLEHELHEAFHIDVHRVFDPHAPLLGGK